MTAPTLPYGAWPSPITPDRLVEGAITVGEIRADGDGDDAWWSESRPAEGGRTQLVHRTPDGGVTDLFGPWDPGAPGGGWNARTALMEYGGGAWGVRDGVVLFANWSDQRLYRTRRGDEPTPITPQPTVPKGWRWSEPTWLDDHWLVCVRESHEPEAIAAHGEAMNELVALPLDGGAADDPGRVVVLASGPDFVHSPAVHGDRIAWIQWSHPAMPWDSTELVSACVERDAAGGVTGLTGERVVAGGPGESIVQPGFTPDAELVCCSDRSGWWSPWRISLEDGTAAPLVDASRGEIGGPLWVGGLRWWTALGGSRLVCSLTAEGGDHLALIDGAGAVATPDTPFTEIGQVVAGGDATVLIVAATADSTPAPYRITLAPGAAADRSAVRVERLCPAPDLGFETTWISVPRHVSFPSADGRLAHGLHYPPVNPDVEAPADQLPPLIVTVHGGPTSRARHRLDLAKQFWTSRGFAVIDVNYGGSTGYGRSFRRLLEGRWGVVDVEDTVAAAQFLAACGEADPQRMAIRGGSAGGYTTLAALCFHEVFAAGASHYGVADLAALAADTHKFESRYLDGLVGPWPDARATYEARSPIFHTEHFDRPLIVLQGSEDEVVPPNQAEMIVEALRAKGVAHAYMLLPGEQHGFRRAESIVTALQAELWFYGKVFGFQPDDQLPGVPGAVGLA